MINIAETMHFCCVDERGGKSEEPSSRFCGGSEGSSRIKICDIFHLCYQITTTHLRLCVRVPNILLNRAAHRTGAGEHFMEHPLNLVTQANLI
ncbi:hypothetical protein D3C74_155160 [compost metagenome]